MENKIISESVVKEVITKILTEETNKVKREEFNRVQFKIEELQNSLNDTIREFRKLEDSVPGGLKGISNGRMTGISNNLIGAQKLLSQLKEKIKQYKRNLYQQQVEEKKK